jgi:hypothetical protein
MKRRLRTLVVFLLLGAIVTVAVAWMCAIYGDSSTGVEAREPNVKEPEYWRNRAPANWDFVPRAIVINRGIGINLTRIANPPGKVYFDWRYGSYWPAFFSYTLYGVAAPGTGDDEVLVLQSGWPVASLQAECWIGRPGSATRSNVGNHCFQCILVERRTGQKLLPLRPIVIGFAVDSLFYSAGIWILTFVGQTVNRTQRIKRGLCAKCAYPVGENDVCTECGAALTLCNGPTTGMNRE